MKKKIKIEPSYSIEFVGHRILDDFRGDRITGEVYTVAKYVLDNNEANYEVIISTFGEECNCPARSHKTCKHRKMVWEYKEKQNVSDG
jgi:hypothetical protein